LANYKGIIQLYCNPFKKTEHEVLGKAICSSKDKAQGNNSAVL
jgi:hypothetical protein